MAEKGDAGAQAALLLMDEPGKFLSSVQIGITLIGVIPKSLDQFGLSEEVRNAVPLAVDRVLAELESLGVVAKRREDAVITPAFWDEIAAQPVECYGRD